MPRNQSPIPENFNSLEEAGDFWDDHSSADYEEQMVEVELDLSKSLRSRLEIKKLYRLLGLSSNQAARIEETAERERIDSRQLISRWVLEHI